MRVSFNPIINGLWLLPWKTLYKVPRSTHIFLTKVGFMTITVGLSHILGKHYIWGFFATDLGLKYYQSWGLNLFFKPRHVLVTSFSSKHAQNWGLRLFSFLDMFLSLFFCLKTFLALLLMHRISCDTSYIESYGMIFLILL